MIIMELYFFRKLNLSGNNFKMFILKERHNFSTFKFHIY